MSRSGFTKSRGDFIGGLREGRKRPISSGARKAGGTVDAGSFGCGSSDATWVCGFRANKTVFPFRRGGNLMAEKEKEEVQREGTAEERKHV